MAMELEGRSRGRTESAWEGLRRGEKIPPVTAFAIFSPHPPPTVVNNLVNIRLVSRLVRNDRRWPLS